MPGSTPCVPCGQLTSPLVAIFRDRRPETEHTLATNILTDYASDDPDLLNLLMDADPKAYCVSSPSPRRQEAKTLPLFQAEIAKKATIPESDKDSEMVKDRLPSVKPGRRSPGSAWEGRGSLAPPAAQCRPPAAELHRQLAESPGADPN